MYFYLIVVESAVSESLQCGQHWPYTLNVIRQLLKGNEFSSEASTARLF